MNLDHYPAEKLKKEILGIVGARLDLSDYRVFFFGSRVDGKHFERSDIDVGIEGEHPVDAKTFLTIQEEVENLPILYKIDMVDFKTVSDRFYRIASKSREYLTPDT